MVPGEVGYDDGVDDDDEDDGAAFGDAALTVDERHAAHAPRVPPRDQPQAAGAGDPRRGAAGDHRPRARRGGRRDDAPLGVPPEAAGAARRRGPRPPDLRPQGEHDRPDAGVAGLDLRARGGPARGGAVARRSRRSGIVIKQQEPVELSPQNAYIRRLQHQMAERANLVSRSRGREPYRRVRLYPDAARPAWR